uniref:Uncharacterized protein n=1 Tax=Glossina austeni TaxID=7395 RepID=A0A1A9V340_GLOAU
MFIITVLPLRLSRIQHPPRPPRRGRHPLLLRVGPWGRPRSPRLHVGLWGRPRPPRLPRRLEPSCSAMPRRTSLAMPPFVFSFFLSFLLEPLHCVLFVLASTSLL